MSRFYQAAKAQSARKTFLEAGSRSISYGELCTDIAKFSAYLTASTLDEGSRVVISATDPYHASLLFMGLVDSGMVPVIAALGIRATEFNLILQTTQAQACIMDEGTLLDCVGHQDLLQLALPIKEPRQKKTLVNKLLGKKKAPESGPPGFPAVLHRQEELAPRQQWPNEYEAYVIMTSGSTSSPKAVVTRHGALFAHLETLKRQFGFSPDTRLFNILPLYHVDGLIQGPAVACFSGVTWLRPFAFSIPNMEAMLLSLYRYRATHFITVPTVLSLITRMRDDHTDCFDYEEFRFVVSAAGYLEVELWTRFEQTYGVRIVNLYGLTETVTGALFCGPDDESHQIGTIGKPVDCEAKVVGEDGSELGVSEVGQLLLRGANVFKGYIGAENANEGVFQDGWLCTGDLAHFDDQGIYSIDGRIKNVVISGGENIYPEEITEVINRHSRVVESCCFGVEHPEWGEILVAAVVVSPGFSETEINNWIEGQLSHYKIPRRWIEIEALPRGPSGKTLVPELKKNYLERNRAKPDGYHDDLEQKILEMAAGIFSVSLASLSDDSTPETTRGWDSLAHVELLLALEREFQVKLSGNDIAEITSLGAARHKIQIKVGGYDSAP